MAPQTNSSGDVEACADMVARLDNVSPKPVDMEGVDEMSCLVNAETVEEGAPRMIETLEYECNLFKSHPLHKTLMDVLAKLRLLWSRKEPSTVSRKPLLTQQVDAANGRLSELEKTDVDLPSLEPGYLWRHAFKEQITGGTSTNYFLRAVALARRVWSKWCQSAPLQQVRGLKRLIGKCMHTSLYHPLRWWRCDHHDARSSVATRSPRTFSRRAYGGVTGDDGQGGAGDGDEAQPQPLHLVDAARGRPAPGAGG